MDMDKNRIIVYAGMILPIAYIFFKWEWPVIILAGAAVFAIYIFTDKFISIEEVRKANERHMQYQQPFMDSSMADFQLDPVTGMPIKRMVPPQQPYKYPPYGGPR